MGLRHFLAVWMVCCVAAPLAHAQDAPGIEEVLDKLENYASEYPQEKVYLHLDKPYYTVGDDIWFTGYVTIGAYTQLYGLSKILYVDLIGPEDHIVQTIRLDRKSVVPGKSVSVRVHLDDSLISNKKHKPNTQ